MSENKAGLGGLKKTLPNLQPIKPIDSVTQEKTKPKQVLRKDKVKRSSPQYLPKTVRVSKEAHRAITTIAMLQDCANYEVVNMLIDQYADNLDPAQRKIIKNSLDLDYR